MDGFEGNNGVIILAATNRPESLDPALTRPGRFDRRVPVELPDLAGREAILKVHARKIKASDDVDFHTIARMASGASGAELANIINEAALRAVRSGRTIVTEADLEESIEKEACKLLAVDLKDHEKLEDFRKAIQEKFERKLDLFFSNRQYLEIVPCGVSKGSALEAFCAKM